MIEGITSCQAIDDKNRVINICPFCNSEYDKLNHHYTLKCKYGAILSYYSCVVINFIPNDCPLKVDDITVKLL